MYTRTQKQNGKPTDYKVIEKVKVVSKEKLHSDKVKRDYGKIYVDDGTDKNKLLMVYRNSLLEDLDNLRDDILYNFSGEKKGNFFHTEGWERWDCSHCKKEKIKKMLIGDNNRIFIIKSIFEGQLKLWKSQMPKMKVVSLDTIEMIFKDIVEELDKDFKEQKIMLESLSND